jgi:hypothetical protein
MLASPRDVVVTSRSRGGGARGDACAVPSPPPLRACLATLAAATAAHAHAQAHAHAPATAHRAAAEGTNKGPLATATAAAARPAAAPPSVIDLTRDTDDDDDAVVNSGAAPAAPAAPAATSEVIDLTSWALDAAEEAAARDVVAAERRGIAAFLASPAGAGLRVVAVGENPHAAPGGALYRRFARARAVCADASVALVFHGTPSANVGSICARGLDPARRQRMALGPGDYFGRTAAVSLAYCGSTEAVAESGGGGGSGGGRERRTRQLIVFAVLTDVSGVTAATHSVLVVHATAHQLVRVRVRACVRACVRAPH